MSRRMLFLIARVAGWLIVRRNRLRRRFPGARVVVFGHSHIPWLEDEEAFLLLNAGSPTDRRRQPEHTFALLWVEGGEVRAEVLAL